MIDEVYLLKRTRPINRPTLYHSTGSATLEKIAASGAILSAREALKMGIPIVNGEYVGYIHPHTDISLPELEVQAWAMYITSLAFHVLAIVRILCIG